METSFTITIAGAISPIHEDIKTIETSEAIEI